MLNSVQLMGRLTAEPERRVTPSGKDVCTFSIAVDRSISQGERKADFIKIVTWGSTAVNVEKYFRKGSMIAINGAIQSRTYEDKKGYKRTEYEVVAKEVYFCDSKNPSTASGSPSLSGTAEVDTSLSGVADGTPSNAGLNGYFATATAADFEEIVVDDELDFGGAVR